MGYQLASLPANVKMKAEDIKIDKKQPSSSIFKRTKNGMYNRLMIGIDPGTDTGYSLYDPHYGNLMEVSHGPILQAMEWIRRLATTLVEIELIRIEDARQRRWFGKRSHAKLQGAGSVKRDCKIWEEFCEYYDYNYEMVHPIKGATKWNADKFQRVTGWNQRTNQNGRDAALLIFGL
jgi:hypothetical protein